MQTFFVEGFDLSKKPNTVRLFLAEGFSEVGYLEAALTILGADSDTTTILCFQGVQRMSGHTKTIVKFLDPQMLEQIKAIGVIADCEDEPKGRIDAIIDCAKAFSFNKSASDLTSTGHHVEGNRKFALSVSPAPNREGRIETLILEEISKTKTMKCIVESFECISAANNGRNIDEKAQVQMFISASMNNAMAGVRQAFLAKIFDVTNKAYEAHFEMVKFIIA